MKDTTLTQFVRDRDGQPRGLVVATVIVSTRRRHTPLLLVVLRMDGDPRLRFLIV